MRFYVLSKVVVLVGANEAFPQLLQQSFLLLAHSIALHFGMHLLCNMAQIAIQKLIAIFVLITSISASQDLFNARGHLCDNLIVLRNQSWLRWRLQTHFLDRGQHIGRQEVRVLSVTRVDLSVEAGSHWQQSKNCYVFRQQFVHCNSHRLVRILVVLTLVVVLNLAAETILQGVHFLVCARGPIPGYLVEVAEIMLSDQV